MNLLTKTIVQKVSRRWWYAGLAVAAVSVAIISFYLSKQPSTEAATTTAAVIRKTINASVSATGAINPMVGAEVEAAFLSAIGGVAGILLETIGALSVNLKAGWPMAFNLLPIVMTFSYALVVGVVFGLYPAVKASRLNPIDALRSK